MLNLQFKTLCLLKHQFKNCQLIKLNRGWLQPDINSLIMGETKDAIRTHSTMMNIDLNKTRRHLRTVSGVSITNDYPNINLFAESDEILEFVRFITNNKNLQAGKHKPLYPAHINYSSAIDEHHGWHLDDAAFKIVFCTQYIPGPDESLNGGCPQYIPHSINPEHTDESLAMRLQSTSLYHEQLLNNGAEYREILDKKIPSSMIKTMYLNEGDAYLLNGRSVLHQVLPLKSNQTQRSAICFSYDYVHDLSNYENSPTSLYEGVVEQDVI
eukprot:95960_1